MRWNKTEIYIRWWEDVYLLSGGGTKPSNIGGGGGEDFPEGGKAAGRAQMIGQHISVEYHEFRSCPAKCSSV